MSTRNLNKNLLFFQFPSIFAIKKEAMVPAVSTPLLSSSSESLLTNAIQKVLNLEVQNPSMFKKKLNSF